MEIYCPLCWQHNSCILIIILFGKNSFDIWEWGLAKHSYFLCLSSVYINRKLFAVQAIEWNLLLEGTADVSNSPVPKKLTDSVMKSSFCPLPRRIQNQSWWHTKYERKSNRVDFSTYFQRQILKKHMFTVQNRTFSVKCDKWTIWFFELFKIQF